jgi:hypothetical protein
LAICRRLAALSCKRSRRACISPIRPSNPLARALIGKGGPNDGRKDFMEVGEPLDCIGEGLLVDLGILSPEAIADCAVSDTGEFKVQLRYSLST